jgi:hypothetical protein
LLWYSKNSLIWVAHKNTKIFAPNLLTKFSGEFFFFFPPFLFVGLA